MTYYVVPAYYLIKLRSNGKLLVDSINLAAYESNKLHEHVDLINQQYQDQPETINQHYNTSLRFELTIQL